MYRFMNLTFFLLYFLDSDRKGGEKFSDNEQYWLVHLFCVEISEEIFQVITTKTIKKKIR